MYSVVSSLWFLLALPCCLMHSEPAEVSRIHYVFKSCPSVAVTVYPLIDTDYYFKDSDLGLHGANEKMGFLKFQGLRTFNNAVQSFKVIEEEEGHKTVGITFELPAVGIVYGKKTFRMINLHPNKFYTEVQVMSAPHCTFKVLKMEAVSFQDIKMDPDILFGLSYPDISDEAIENFQKDMQEIVKTFLLDHLKRLIEHAVGEGDENGCGIKVKC